MKFIKDKKIAVIFIEEKDFSELPTAIKGCNIDMCFVPEELKDKFLVSEVRKAIILSLYPKGKIYYYK